MGKPRLLILIRHAQSEGNKNREIHQLIPDHRVKLTEEGWKQAEDAGHRLRALLRPDDTLQIYTSPYRRTRETTEGILRTLTSTNPDHGAPSPFSRNSIKLYEEPRLREQDFGNFQPCSAEMERMWQERADYGHFFYRIPNGESAADAYDRISGFNETLWRQFGESSFASVCVLVTHGLMTRVFLMKWYHWSVEYFEDLRNVNHCEFVIMKQNPDNGKYILQNELRTWSALKRQRAEEARQKDPNGVYQQLVELPSRRNTLSQFVKNDSRSITGTAQRVSSSPPPPAKWGGCVGGCDHHHERYPRRDKKQDAAKDSIAPVVLPKQDLKKIAEKPEPTSPRDSNGGEWKSLPGRKTSGDGNIWKVGRDGGGSPSSNASPNNISDDEFFSQPNSNPSFTKEGVRGRALSSALRKAPRRQATEEDIERWAQESGMGSGRKADALGDEPEPEVDEDIHEIDPSGSDDEDGVHHGTTRAVREAVAEVQKEKQKNQSIRASVY